jgi:hypothetical protein
LPINEPHDSAGDISSLVQSHDRTGEDEFVKLIAIVSASVSDRENFDTGAATPAIRPAEKVVANLFIGTNINALTF